MDSASRVSGSVCGSALDGPLVFCVVCGSFSDDLVVRKSGLKCPSCVGKSANAYFAKLQKRQATHLLSQSLPGRSPSAGLDTTSSIPPGDGLRSQRVHSSESSSLPPTTEGYNSATGASTTHSGSFHPIEEYISGTSVFRAVVKEVLQSQQQDCSAGGGGSSDPKRPARGAGGGAARGKLEAPRKDGRGNNVAADAHPSAPTPAAAAGAAGEGHGAPPPLVTQRQTAGNAQSSKSGLGKRPYDSDAGGVPTRTVLSVPPTLTHTKAADRQDRDGGPPAQQSNAAPSRLPPRNGPRKSKGAPKLPSSLAGGAMPPADKKTDAKPNRSMTETSSLNGATASSAAHGVKVTSVTVHCPEGDDTMSESCSGTFRGGVLPSMESAANTQKASPSAPRDDGAALSGTALLQQRAPAPQKTRGEGCCTSSSSLAISYDANANLPAPRAGSRDNSIASTVTDRQSISRLPMVRSRVGSCESTHARLDAEAVTERSSAATSSATAMTCASARHADANGASGTRVSLLSRMPGTSSAAAAVDSTSRGDGRNRRCLHAEQGGNSASSSGSESSSSRESFAASATSSSLPTVISSAPRQVGNEDAAPVKEAGGTRTQRSSTNALGLPASEVAKKRVKKKAPHTAEEDREGEKTSHGLAGPSLSGNIDALSIAVQLMLPPSPSVPETSTSAPSGGDGPLHAGTSSNDESSTATGDSHSRSDSMRSGSSRTNDGYQRKVCTGGQSGRFMVTMHTRMRSGGSDAPGGLSGASAAAASSSGTSPGARMRRRKQQGSSSDLIGTGAVEVKKICYRLLLQDRSSGSVLITKERRLYTDIIPALERVKMVAGSELPELPVKRLPSLRIATEGFMEERRAEVEAFLQAVLLSPFYIRHPDVVKLLGLEPYVAGQSSPGSTTGANRSRRALGARKMGASSSIEGTAGMEVTPPGRAGDGSSSTRSLGNSKGGAAAAGATAASGPDERCAGYLSTAALNPYRASAAGEVGDGSSAASGRGFRRTQSYSSVQTSRSSVVRRRKLDEVTMEDLEHIQLGNLLGRGTFGSVYLGLVQTQRGSLMVAVKVMRVGESVAPSEMESLQRELDVLCAARHKNIIRFLGSSLNTTTRDLRVFTEYVECGTIRSLVDRFGALTMLAIQQYMHQILSGLQHLHSLSIAHRDIKGENILVTKNGRVKLSDFGSSTGAPCGAGAAVLPLEGSSGGNADSAADGGLPVGSPQYMAPEVILGTVQSAAAADIWSLGCVGIEMMDRPIWRENANTNPFVFLYRIGRSGTPPHGLPTDNELAALKADGRVTEYEGFCVYQDFLKSCLRVDPAQRPSASELLKHPFMTYPYSKHLRWMPLTSAAKPS
ncbi:hypothetical protein LSCM1_07353 [Leishmania martiniquensis]|uniref:Protein kinase domain-containing protein n=1 Tax=Leishmania martiniquensis TaxID=1580590 RepID=A0A836KTC9_9TRYP|nr:hypothetical protein LSCM1_07353 [Leishmania martiniquensis]